MQQLIEDLLKSGGFEIREIILEEKAPSDYYLNIVPEVPALLIGHRGEGLQALQHLIKTVLRCQNLLEENTHLKIDIDSYRQKQEVNVLEMADRRARQVVETGRQAYLPPMSSFFRRLVHVHVKEKYPNLVTYSQGEGSFRAVCIANELTPGEEAEAQDLYMDVQL